MPNLAALPLRVALVAGLLLVAGASGPLAQERVGINSGVNPEATGTPPGATPRRLVIGQDVVFNERITTADTGQTQLLFLDESSMTIGPKSDLTIDQFVYDPKSGTGKLAMSATRGIFRYVGGKLSKQDEAVTLRTSTATLAVRGGAFIAQIAPGGTTLAAFIYGKGLTINGLAGGSLTLTRPGFQSITTPGGSPSPPAPQPPGQLALFTQLLDGQTGGTGGATDIPFDTHVVNSGVTQTISGNLTQSFQQSQQHQGGTQFTPQPTTDTSSARTTTTLQTNGAGQVIDCISAATCNPTNTIQVGTTPSGQPVGGPNSISGATPVIAYAGVSKTGVGMDLPDQTSRSNVPFGSGTLSNGTFSATVGGSSLSFPLATGTSTFSPTGSSAGGKVSGTSFLSNNGAFFYANLNAANGQSFFVSGGQAVPSSALASTGATRIFAFDLSAAPSPTSIPFSIQDDLVVISKPSLTPLYLVAPASTAIGDTSTASAARTLHATVAFSGQGSGQSSTVLMHTGTVGTLQSSGAPIITGVLRGVESSSGSGSETYYSAVSSVVDGNGQSLYGTNTITGFTLDQTRFASTTTGTVGKPVASTATETEGVVLGSSRDTYGFAQPAVATTVPTGVGANRTTQTQTGYFGGLMQTTATSTPYAITGAASIATDNSANTVNATFTSDQSLTSSATGGVTAITMNLGGKQSAFVDDNIFGAAEDPTAPQQINGKQLVVNGDSTQASQLYLLSSATAALPTSLLPSGVSFCQCQFLQWGYWGGDLLTGNSSDSNISRIDHGHINFWVAGVPTPLNDLNTLMSQSAIGSYTGHAIGSVSNNGANYVAAGGFNGTYNFGTQTGTMAINNFDGRSFTATGNAALSGAKYTLGVTSTGVTGTINGAFYGPNAAETGGNFAVQAGSTYLASGIFAGKR
jgi:hypothetical protein